MNPARRGLAKLDFPPEVEISVRNGVNARAYSLDQAGKLGSMLLDTGNKTGEVMNFMAWLTMKIRAQVASHINPVPELASAFAPLPLDWDVIHRSQCTHELFPQFVLNSVWFAQAENKYIVARRRPHIHDVPKTFDEVVHLFSKEPVLVKKERDHHVLTRSDASMVANVEFVSGRAGVMLLKAILVGPDAATETATGKKNSKKVWFRNWA